MKADKVMFVRQIFVGKHNFWGWGGVRTASWGKVPLATCL